VLPGFLCAGHIGQAQPAVLVVPDVKGCLADTQLQANIRDRYSNLGFVQFQTDMEKWNDVSSRSNFFAATPKPRP
jgi:hypothetical protein